VTHLKIGTRLRSQVDGTQVIVIRAAPGELTCGGHPMIEVSQPPGDGLTLAPEHRGPTAVGKRYADAASGLEVLVITAGDGALALAGCALHAQAAKALPSSD
jgi:hypothetical protein